MRIKPASREAYQLLHEGSIALAQVESVGMRMDVDYIEKAIEQTTARIKRNEERLKSHKLFRAWQKMHGVKTKLGAKEQLVKVLIAEGVLKNVTLTDKKRIKADEAVLETVDSKFVRLYIETEKLKKAVGTYLKGFKAETVDGFMHPFFHLHTTKSMRGSSSSPNFQNIPTRNPLTKELLRRCFIPREGHQIAEIDFKGVEVAIAYCYHKDPVMRTYLLDKSKDMHRDMAAQCYLCDPDEVTPDMRHVGKNQFVFPQFYGSNYVRCAPALWASILRRNLQLKDGTLVGDYIEEKGIRELGRCDSKEKPVKGTFEHHIREVDKDFWGVRFKVYSEWKDQWFKQYCRRGWFEMYTGFVISGILERNKVINYPVQGAAFHCLLWSLIQLQKWLKKRKMRSVIIGQIHDSLIMDLHCNEANEVLRKIHKITTKSLLEHWQWISIPLEVEFEACVPGASWYEKEEVKFDGNTWNSAKTGKVIVA